MAALKSEKKEFEHVENGIPSARWLDHADEHATPLMDEIRAERERAAGSDAATVE